MRYASLFVVFCASVSASQCYFNPPQGWQGALPKTPSPHVKLGFIGEGSTNFRPSITYATEEVDVSLKEYIKAVKELQLADPNVKWRDLGKFKMAAGQGRLTEIIDTTAWGEIRIFQAIFVHDHTAHLLTASILKDDLPKFQNEIMKSLRSLNIVEDLWSAISDTQQQEHFRNLFASLGTSEDKDLEWEQLKNVVESLSSLGPHWQSLALQEGHSKIYQLNIPQSDENEGEKL